jgi:hypothetical protein
VASGAPLLPLPLFPTDYHLMLPLQEKLITVISQLLGFYQSFSINNALR